MPDISLISMISIAIAAMGGLFVGVILGYYLSGPRPPEEEQKGPENMKEIARIWSDRRSGQMAVEMERKLYRNGGELNPRQRAALATVRDLLLAWLSANNLPGRAQPGEIAPTIRVPQQPAQPSLRPAGGASPALGQETPRPPSLELPDIISEALVPTPGKPGQAVFKSIAAQVDEIVQERLPDSSFAGRIIELRDLPKGGMVVVVDGEQYQGVGDVADLDVRAFLQDCVGEWERRTGSSK